MYTNSKNCVCLLSISNRIKDGFQPFRAFLVLTILFIPYLICGIIGQEMMRDESATRVDFNVTCKVGGGGGGEGGGGGSSRGGGGGGSSGGGGGSGSVGQGGGWGWRRSGGGDSKITKK